MVERVEVCSSEGNARMVLDTITKFEVLAYQVLTFLSYVSSIICCVGRAPK